MLEPIIVYSENKDEYFNSCSIECWRSAGAFRLLLYHLALPRITAGWSDEIYDSGYLEENLRTTIRFTPTNLMYLLIVSQETISGYYRISFFFDDNYELLDEDDMASDSEDSVSSQQSIKAYVDSQEHQSDADIESIITAELVDGQSIDNRIDELISESSIGLTLYLALNADAVETDYLIMCHEFPDEAKTEIFNITVSADNQELEQFITPIACPSMTEILPGYYNLHAHTYKFSGEKDLRLYFKLYKYETDTNETLLGTSAESSILGDSEADVDMHIQITSAVPLDITDRLIIKVFAHLEGSGNNPVIYFYVEGDTMVRFSFPISQTQPNHNSLVGLNDGVNYEHITQTQKTALAEHATYIIAQHTRRIEPFKTSPQDGYTVGANNVYESFGIVMFGKDSNTNNHNVRIWFLLPEDYVEGTDLIVSIEVGGTASDVLDYDIDLYRYADNVVTALEDSEDDTWTLGATAGTNYETLTFTGTDFNINDVCCLLMQMEDDDNANVSYLFAFSLDIQVNSRD